MKLHGARIRNFRSIEDLTITLEPTCRVLVGINESGKSNILKALSTLSSTIMPSKKDIRTVLPDEAPVQESFVYFAFSLDDAELRHVSDNVKSKLLSTNHSMPILRKGDHKFTFEQFCKMKREKPYVVDVIKGKKYPSAWNVSETYELTGNWKKLSAKCPSDFTIPIPADGDAVAIKKFSFIGKDLFNDIPEEYLSDISFDDVDDAVNLWVSALMEDSLPEVIYWDYSDENLLPSQIDINQFVIKPAGCIPLKHMFGLAQITDIKKAFDDARSVSVHAQRNLLNRVADQATKHFHNVWKEYKSISFHLALNGNNIDASVKDKFNHYEFSLRSDGFKRFVTFLLLISARVKINQLQQALLLVDEPDMSLHPSGARYLRDELIKISDKNYVVYSTHSIFMIDKENIERHLIVKKVDEKTSVVKADESNIVDEEVIFNALGYSIFESLKKKNIIFEGRRDKILCELAIHRMPAQFKHLKDVLKDVGLCYVKGVKDVQNVTPLLELANRSCLILSDDDTPAKEKQKKYVENKYYGTWKRYSEVYPDAEAVTGEDFIKPDAFRKSISNSRKKYPDLPELSDAELSHPKGKIYALQNWLRRGGISQEGHKEIIDTIKENVFSDLKQVQIENSYYKMLEALVKLL